LSKAAAMGYEKEEVERISNELVCIKVCFEFFILLCFKVEFMERFFR
jgi:hypothetical protein